MSLSDRVRLAIVEHPRLAPVVVLVAGLSLATIAVSLALVPPTEIVTEETLVQEYAFETESQADVTVENELYPRDTLLRDHPEYFLEYSPELSLLMRTEAPPTETVQLSETVEMRITGSDGDRVFYDRTETLSELQHTIRDGEHTHETVIDMRALSDRMGALIADSNGVGTFDVELIVTLAYDTEVYQGEITDSTALVIDEQVYYLADTPAASQEESLTVTKTAVRSPNPVIYYGSMVAGFSLLLALFPIRRIRSTADPAQLRVKIARDRHTEWISAGDLLTTGQYDYIRTETLQDLIDIAIDSDRRVIYDETLDMYGIIEDNRFFFYSPWDRDLGDWLRL